MNHSNHSMQKLALRHIALLFVVFCTFAAQAQHEHIEFLPQTSQHSLLKSSENTLPNQLLALPFFDDFAYPQRNPSTQLWADNHTFVNIGFAENPPTIGVLSLDALNSNGALYEEASSSVFVADYATSQAINLFDYRSVFASDKLYAKNGSALELIEKDRYYLYNHSLRNFVDMVKGIPYYAGDTVYIKTTNGFEASQIELYDENQKLIAESSNNSRTWTPYAASDNIMLSFYYQAGGKADKPEAQDSLILEFYTPFARQGVFINEITPQWIEIFNATDSIVSLSDYYFVADTLENLSEQEIETWRIAEMFIAPYSHTIAQASDFQIKEFTSSQFYLLSPEKTEIDNALLEKSVSAENLYARLPDGNPEWSFSAEETPAHPNNTWKRMWGASAKGMNPETFSTAIIPLTETYLQKGFRFRFKNYASLSNDESHARNEDFWHIDMVWIDANRDETQANIADVAFSVPITSLFNRYTALPKTHFVQLKEDDFRMALESSFRNFDKESRKIKFHFAVRNSQNSNSISFSSYETDLEAFQTVEKERDILSDHDVKFFDYLSTESAAVDSIDFEFQYFFTDNNNPLFEQYRWNDTSRVSLKFGNYYAYDDGTPEAGYGLRNAPMGKVAYKFDVLQPDTLRSILMYFNPTLDQNPKLFNLCVWAVGEKGKPGKLLYRRTSTRVQHSEELFGFTRYAIEDEGIQTGESGGIYVGNSFFIGWEQPNDVLLNIGMDLTNEVRNRLYFNASYDWEASVMPGALLIRPQFGESISTEIPNVSKQNVLVYPTIINHSATVQSQEEILRCEFVSISGRSFQQSLLAGNTIDCSNIPNGFYLLKLYGKSGLVAVQKCVIRR